MPKDEDEIVEVRCPECNERVRVPRAKAESDYKATCAKGHEILLAKAI